MTDEQAKPRWAKGLGERTWRRINELIDAGFAAPYIQRELKIPDAKLRSLQVYVRKFGPRRRLEMFADFKTALFSHIGEFGAGMVDSLGVIARLAVSNETDAKTQVRALEAMTAYVKVAKNLAADDAKEILNTEASVETPKGGKLSEEAIETIQGIYGLDHPDGGDHGES